MMHDFILVTVEHSVQTFHFRFSQVSEDPFLKSFLTVSQQSYCCCFFHSPVAERSPPPVGTIELHCFLSTYKGYVPCNNRGIHIKWSTGDDTPLHGNRFRFEKPSECFSKLIITKRVTDHHRKWKCKITQNDTVKATVSYTTTVKGTKLHCNVLQINF